ncbi:hypothetical protein PI125_g24407 [Phytophthora idaei]|nr:hypothetical protein PI125_g24407 [Phytophthora idaei]
MTTSSAPVSAPAPASPSSSSLAPRPTRLRQQFGRLLQQQQLNYH